MRKRRSEAVQARETISGADLSPDSPYWLSPGSRYVVGYRDDSGGVVIYSQHRQEGQAEATLASLLRESTRNRKMVVFEVHR